MLPFFVSICVFGGYSAKTGLSSGPNEEIKGAHLEDGNNRVMPSFGPNKPLKNIFLYVFCALCRDTIGSREEIM